MLLMQAAWSPNHGPTRGVPWMALYYYTLTPDQVCCYSATNAGSCPFAPKPASVQEAEQTEHRWLNTWNPSRLDHFPDQNPSRLPIALGSIRDLFSIPWGCARSGLRLPFQPSHTFFMTHVPSWHSDYIAFLSVVWITQAFSSLKVFVHRTLLAWAITPPGLHPPDFRVHMKLSLLQRVFPLWPHPTTPLPLRSLRASCSFVIVLTTVFDSGPCLFCFLYLQSWTKD